MAGFIARGFGRIQGGGAAAAGPFQGLSPRVLAFIQGLQQQKEQSEEAERRHQETIERDERRFQADQDERMFQRGLAERKFSLLESRDKEQSRLSMAKLVTPIMQAAQQKIDAIMADPKLTPQQKATRRGQIIQRATSNLRNLGGKDFDTSGFFANLTPEEVSEQIRTTPRTFDSDATQGFLNALSGAEASGDIESLLRGRPPEVDPEAAGRTALQRLRTRPGALPTSQLETVLRKRDVPGQARTAATQARMVSGIQRSQQEPIPGEGLGSKIGGSISELLEATGLPEPQTPQEKRAAMIRMFSEGLRKRRAGGR